MQPLVYDQALYRRIYSVYDGESGRSTERYRTHYGHIQNAFEIAPDSRVLIVGCGLGFLVEIFRDSGYDAWGIDSSPWIAEIAPDEVPEILPYMIFADVTSLLGHEEFDWVISENAIEGHRSGVQQQAFTMACEELAPAPARVIHMVSDNLRMDQMFVVQTIAEWKKIDDEQNWISCISGEVA